MVDVTISLGILEVDVVFSWSCCGIWCGEDGQETGCSLAGFCEGIAL